MYKPIILCVDDEAIVLTSLKEQLKRHFAGKSFAIEVADDPENALEIISELDNHKNKIVVVISDWMMPGMKGDEFLRQVHLKYPNIVTIMLTGQADEKSIDSARKDANLFECIYKPWDANKLTNTIEKAIDVFSDN